MKQYLLTIAMLIMAHAQASLAKPIHDAAKAGDLAAVRAILEAEPSEIETTDNKGYTALHVAAFDGHADVVRLLLEKRANPCAVNNAGNTPLHLAGLLRQRSETMELLLANGAEPEARNLRRETALCIVATRGSLKRVALLIEHGATVGDQELSAANRAWFKRDALKAMLTPENIRGSHLAAAQRHTAAGNHAKAAQRYTRLEDHGAAAESYKLALAAAGPERLKSGKDYFQKMIESLKLAALTAPSKEVLDGISSKLTQSTAQATHHIEQELVRIDTLLEKYADRAEQTQEALREEAKLLGSYLDAIKGEVASLEEDIGRAYVRMKALLPSDF